MPRRQCRNQLRPERVRETSKLVAIIDDDDAMQESLRDLIEAAGLVAQCCLPGRIPRIRFALSSRVPDN
jgi:hypothetical protein